MIYQNNRLKQIFGSKCTAININGESDSYINIPIREMRLCEAVKQSFKVPVRISIENLDCPGARRSVGFESDERQLIEEITGHSQISESYIINALLTIPALTGIRHINLGVTESMENDLQPDLYIMYVQPFIITNLMHNLAKLEIRPSIPSYSFLSVCGNVLANCYFNQVVSISFGCPESRNHGGIGKNEIVLGLPAKIASKLLQYYEQERIEI
jgi:uncharacterized protein (DUF169 family)